MVFFARRVARFHLCGERLPFRIAAIERVAQVAGQAFTGTFHRIGIMAAGDEGVHRVHQKVGLKGGGEQAELGAAHGQLRGGMAGLNLEPLPAFGNEQIEASPHHQAQFQPEHIHPELHGAHGWVDITNRQPHPADDE